MVLINEFFLKNTEPARKNPWITMKAATLRRKALFRGLRRAWVYPKSRSRQCHIGITLLTVVYFSECPARNHETTYVQQDKVECHMEIFTTVHNGG
jgi:hypothetical protein